MAKLRVVSADSHVMEPADLWESRLDRRFRDRAPRVIKSEKGPAYIFVAPGANPFPVAGGFAAGKKDEELLKTFEGGYENARPSGWDPAERLKDQDVDGVEAEVLYTTLAMSLFSLSDAELQRASFETYNDWLAEYCAHAPKRLYGIALISLEDVDLAVQDLERAKRSGMRGCLIWGSPPEDRPYHRTLYDPFWQAASELRMPVSLHVITGKSKESQVMKWRNAGVAYMCLIQEVQRSLADIIFGGVLERFPELRIVSAENDCGWIPHFMYRMDHAYEKYAPYMKNLPQPPSYYVKRQLFATFQDDPIGPLTHEIFGTESYMWASDFPHLDSTWPDSRQWIEKNFAGVPDAVKRRIVFENAVALYGMELD